MQKVNRTDKECATCRWWQGDFDIQFWNRKPTSRVECDIKGDCMAIKNQRHFGNLVRAGWRGNSWCSNCFASSVLEGKEISHMGKHRLAVIALTAAMSCLFLIGCDDGGNKPISPEQQRKAEERQREQEILNRLDKSKLRKPPAKGLKSSDEAAKYLAPMEEQE